MESLKSLALTKAYEKAGQTLSDEEAMDEIAADYTQAFLEDTQMFRDFAEANRTAAEKLIDFAKEIIAKIKKTFGNRKQQNAAAVQETGYDLDTLENALKLWEKAYAEGQKAVKNAPVQESTGEGQIKKSVAGSENILNGKKITAGISDSERTWILQKKSISVPVYSAQAYDAIEAEKHDIESEEIGLIKKALVRIGKEFGVFKKYKNLDMNLEVSFSVGNVKESAKKAITNPAQLAKLLPVFDTAIESAVGIETHDNRYFADDQTLFFHELLGGYINEDGFVPVRFGVKEFKNGTCTLYVVVCQERIKTEVVKSEHMDKSSGDPDSRSFIISVSDIATNVKTPDLLRYLPDGLFNEDQIATKYEALADTVRYTNKKNDKAYAEAIARGDIPTVQRIVDRAANMAGLNDNNGELWWRFGDFATPASNSYAANALHIGTKTAAENRAKDIRADIDSMNVNAFNVEEYESRNAKYSTSATQPFYVDISIDSVIDVMRSEDVGSNENWQKVISEARKDGYKAIRYSNLYEDPGSVSLIVIDPTILKSAEAITYDDNGNVIPISQRFDSSKKDIRYSISGTEDILFESRERAQGEQDTKDWLKYLRNQVAVTKQTTVDPVAVRKLAKQLIQSWGVEMEVDDIAPDLQQAVDSALRSKGDVNDAYQQMVAIGRKIAESYKEISASLLRAPVTLVSGVG